MPRRRIRPSRPARKAMASTPEKDSVSPPEPEVRGRSRGPWLALTGAVLALVLEAVLSGHKRPVENSAIARHETGGSGREGEDTVRLGDAALTAASARSPEAAASAVTAEDSLPEPLPGQMKPDPRGGCPGKGQLAFNGGCWVRIPFERQACEESGYVYTGQCYGPVLANARRRQPTSEPGTPP
jgi:eukaryotic-like serine/threonine-protein kinase